MNKNNFSKNIVIGLAANKSDLIDKEEVPEGEARQFALDIGAIFKLTSASNGSGIEDMFKSIGCKYLDPNYKDDDEVYDNSSGNQSSSGASRTMKLDASKVHEANDKKGCCK